MYLDTKKCKTMWEMKVLLSLKTFSALSVKPILIQVSEVQNCLKGNTMSNRGAYSTKERMPSDRKQPLPLPAWKAVPDWLSRMISCDVLPSRQQNVYGLNPRTSSFLSYVRGYSQCCLPGNSKLQKHKLHEIITKIFGGKRNNVYFCRKSKQETQYGKRE